VTTDLDAGTWPQPETHNVIAVDGQPKIEIAPDSSVDGIYAYWLESVDLTGGKIASQIFKPTSSFKLGAIGFYADGIGTFNLNTPEVDDHIPLTVHLYQLVSGSAGTASMPTSYNLSTAGTDGAPAMDLLGGGNGLQFTYDGVDAFSYEFVSLNFSGVDQVELLANSVYAIEIRGSTITGAFNPQRLAPGGLGGTNPYADGDSYDAANGTLTTARSQSVNRDLMMAIYEAIPTVTPPQPGDFDGDGDVDGADFVAWQTNFPKAADATLSEGDADGDGDVDGADFVVWQTNFPFTPSPGASPVPEPAAALLAAFAIPALIRYARVRRKS
jgi:hypothetical protein